MAYDLSKAFGRIENELIDSMMRNLERHKAEETKEGFNWEQWQALQLQELERYRRENASKFTGSFQSINRKIGATYQSIYKDAQAQQEAQILDLIKKGKFKPPQDKDIRFFGINDAKMDILIERTKADFERAEYAMLRRADDIYRQTIFDAQVYANVTNDYNKAVDMATHDFLMKGIQSVQYKNGARHNMKDYARMALRTGNKRAYLMGEGNARDKYGIHTVRVNKRTQACPLCVRFLGKILVDDVYGGGTIKEAVDLGVLTLSQAMDEGFLHPNCKDIYSMYIDGISRDAKPWTKKEIEEIVGEYNQEQELQRAQDMAESYERMAKYSLDPDNKQKYQQRADNWNERADEIEAGTQHVITPPQTTTPTTVTQADKDRARQLQVEINKTRDELRTARAEMNRVKMDIGEEFYETNWVAIDAEASIFKQTHAEVIAEQISDLEREIASASNPSLKEEWQKRLDRLKFIRDNVDKFEDGTWRELLAGTEGQKRVEELTKRVESLEKAIETKEKEFKAVPYEPPKVPSKSDIHTKKAEEIVIRCSGIKYEPLTPSPERRLESEIIQSLAGGDMTKGSCASLSFAYAGNKAGYDVKDFRGGQSQNTFSMNVNIEKIATLPNVVCEIQTEFNEIKGATALLGRMEEGKEYILRTGRHASVVRLMDGVPQYLELQSATNSGWHEFKPDTLKRRFGCAKSRSFYGQKYKTNSLLIDVASLSENDEFPYILGYINTAESQQKKGALGSVK